VIYRDRAAERREGGDKDFEQIEKELIPEEIASLPKDSTKFLGGDEEHTHLVTNRYPKLHSYRFRR